MADTLQAIVETNEANNALTLTFNVLHGTLGPGDQMPHVLALSAPWPNPAAGRASLSLELPGPSVVEWAVHDVQGRAVWREAVRPYGPGHWTLAWDGRTRAGSPAPAGVYLVRVRVGDTEFTRRVVRVR